MIFDGRRPPGTRERAGEARRAEQRDAIVGGDRGRDEPGGDDGPPPLEICQHAELHGLVALVAGRVALAGTIPAKGGDYAHRSAAMVGQHDVMLSAAMSCCHTITIVSLLRCAARHAGTSTFGSGLNLAPR